MNNLSYRYNQHSADLTVNGFPDVSSSSNQKSIGILSSWTLQLVGHPLLEGKKEHLDYLMTVILSYSRYMISDLKSSFVSPNHTVSLFPLEGNLHKLILKSSQKGVKPIDLILDDSQLVDLTRCLDDLRFDQNVDIKWSISSERPIKKDNLIFFRNFKSNLLFPMLGSIIFLLLSFGFYNLYNQQSVEIESYQHREKIIK